MTVLQLLLALMATFTGIPRDIDPSLTAVAQTRASELSATTDWTHRYLGELSTGEWATWGEIIGSTELGNGDYRTMANSMIGAWERSPTHRSVMRDTSYDSVGCAIVEAYRPLNYLFVCVFGNHAETPGSTGTTSTTTVTPSHPEVPVMSDTSVAHP